MAPGIGWARLRGLLDTAAGCSTLLILTHMHLPQGTRGDRIATVSNTTSGQAVEYFWPRVTTPLTTITVGPMYPSGPTRPSPRQAPRQAKRKIHPPSTFRCNLVCLGACTGCIKAAQCENQSETALLPRVLYQWVSSIECSEGRP
ncbi:hypothetical protein FB567DRAFT_121268 [Paraphoma chrysanthemicola]|uniref:Secreted protein n=1 Tax=Paraphoma chrysanthemicola TaxID=798071 RepID=A0A8K0R0I5_9PLEO|nr:hypothetical protein FB567DRAFT_121268 [Paraphoma chrysanthemicola]